MTNKKTIRKRDIYLISILMVLFGALFFVFQYVIYAKDASYAQIYYGLGDPLVSIDFLKQEIVINDYQSVPENYSKTYPSINYNGEYGYVEITLLGDYEINDIRQEVIIAVDFEQNRIQVKDEESPLNVCSKQGWSTAAPLICLPNRIRVEFDSTNANVDFIQ